MGTLTQKLPIWLLMIMAAGTILSSSRIQVHGAEPDNYCLTEEIYKTISNANTVNITEAIIHNQKELSYLKEQGDHMKEELKKMRESQAYLEKIISVMAESLSSVSTGFSFSRSDKPVTASPMTIGKPITVQTIRPEVFYAAARVGDIDLINAVLEQGNSNMISSILSWQEENRDRTALHVAAKEGHNPVVVALLQAGANPNAKDDDGETPLHYFVDNEHNTTRDTPDTLKVLLEHGADIHRPDERGRSPLTLAARAGNVAIAQALITAGARLGDGMNSIMGWTALHMAARENHQNVARLLLHHGADKAQQDDEGRTPAELARHYGHDEVAALIDQW